MQEPGDLREQANQPFARQGSVLAISDDGLFAQVRIPTYHTGITDDLLPWYIVMQPNSITGHNVDGLAKVYSSLAEGTRVLVALFDSNGTSGAVLGILPNKSNAARPDDVVHGWEDNIGNSLLFTRAGEIKFKAKSGLTINVTASGDLTINGKDIKINADKFDTEAEQSVLLASSMTVAGQTTLVTGATATLHQGGGTSGNAPTLTPRTLPSAPDVSDKTEW